MENKSTPIDTTGAKHKAARCHGSDRVDACRTSTIDSIDSTIEKLNATTPIATSTRITVVS